MHVQPFRHDSIGEVLAASLADTGEALDLIQATPLRRTTIALGSVTQHECQIIEFAALRSQAAILSPDGTPIMRVALSSTLIGLPDVWCTGVILKHARTPAEAESLRKASRVIVL